MDTSHPEPIHIFYIFAMEDKEYGEKLKKHLTSLQKRYHFTDWHHNHVLAGEKIEQTNEHIDKADIILLLISADFVSSEIHEKQIQRAMEKYNKQKAFPIIPIKLRPADLGGQPFEGLQLLPREGGAITEWKNEEAAFVQIAEEIDKVISKIVKERTGSNTLHRLLGK